MPIINDEIEYLMPNQSIDYFGVDFHEMTSIRRLASQEDQEKIRVFTSNPRLVHMGKRHLKTYPQKKSIPLDNGPSAKDWLSELLERRKSNRDFSGDPTSFSDFSYILGRSCGLANPIDEQSWSRTYPSGGGLYPLEVYAGVFNVDGMLPGIYHFNVRGNSLEVVSHYQSLPSFIKCYPGESDYLPKATFCIVITALHERNTMKYSAKGWRVMLIECGHLGQNLILSATRRNVKSYPSAAGFDREVCKLLNVHPLQEKLIQTYMFGQ